MMWSEYFIRVALVLTFVNLVVLLLRVRANRRSAQEHSQIQCEVREVLARYRALQRVLDSTAGDLVLKAKVQVALNARPEPTRAMKR